MTITEINWMTMTSKWDNRFLSMAREIATWSKDPSKQIGAVAVSDQGQVLSQGYNGFPRGISDSDSRLFTRDEKYKYVVHAEMNVIYNATYTGVSLDGATLYVVGLPVCSECAKGIIQTGVKRIVMADVEGGMDRWKESWELSKMMFDEVGIQYEFSDYESDK
jgi:dCMP deaminase